LVLDVRHKCCGGDISVRVRDVDDTNCAESSHEVFQVCFHSSFAADGAVIRISGNDVDAGSCQLSQGVAIDAFVAPGSIAVLANSPKKTEARPSIRKISPDSQPTRPINSGSDTQSQFPVFSGEDLDFEEDDDETDTADDSKQNGGPVCFDMAADDDSEEIKTAKPSGGAQISRADDIDKFFDELDQLLDLRL